MRRLAITLSFALAVLVPSWAWALPFAGATIQVCEPLEPASLEGGSGELEADESPSCQLVRFETSEDLDLSRGWAPVCDPSGASGASGVYVYDSRRASMQSAPMAASLLADCNEAPRLDLALVQGHDQPGPDAGFAAVGWAVLPDVVLVPAAPVIPTAAPVLPADGATPGHSAGVYRPPLP